MKKLIFFFALLLSFNVQAQHYKSVICQSEKIITIDTTLRFLVCDSGITKVMREDSLLAWLNRNVAGGGGITLSQLNDSLLKYLNWRDTAAGVKNMATQGEVARNFYPLSSNPASYITSSALAPYFPLSDTTVKAITITQLNDTLGKYLTKKDTIAGVKNVATQGEVARNFYPLSSNPASYITSSALAPYFPLSDTTVKAITITQLNDTLSKYLTKKDTIAGVKNVATQGEVARNFYPLSSNPASYITSSALAPYFPLSDTTVKAITITQLNDTLSKYLTKKDTIAGVKNVATQGEVARNFYPRTGNPSSFLTNNQSITWTGSGDVSGSASGATSISPTLTIVPGAVTNYKLKNDSIQINGTWVPLGGSITISGGGGTVPTFSAGTADTVIIDSIPAVQMALLGTVPVIVPIPITDIAHYYVVSAFQCRVDCMACESSGGNYFVIGATGLAGVYYQYGQMYNNLLGSFTAGVNETGIDAMTLNELSSFGTYTNYEVSDGLSITADSDNSFTGNPVLVYTIRVRKYLYK